MRAAILAAVLVASCGGSSAPPRAPNPAATPDELVARLDAHADRVCACRDHACTERLDDWITDEIADAPAPTDADTFPRAEAAIQRAVQCAWTHETVALGFASIPQGVLRSVRDETCACTEFACVVEVQTRRGSVLTHLGTVPVSREVHDELTALRHEMTACTDVLIDQTPFIQEVLRFRDRACACAFGDRACADAVQIDVQAWSKTATFGPATPREQARSKQIARELGTCISNASEQPPP